MTPVCITVDDYGLRPENDAVIRMLVAAGRVDAVSITVHADASTDQLASFAETDVATGLHLVLVGERPLEREALRDLLDHDGYLPSSWLSLAAALARRPRSIEGLRAEIRAQLGRYLALGLPLDFVNGHQHTHLFPPVWRVLREELRRFGVAAAVRVPAREPLRPDKRTLIATATRVAFHAAPPDGPLLSAFGLDWSGHASRPRVDVSLARIARARSEPSSTLAELVLHPGADPRGAASRHLQWGYRWKDETELLVSGAIDACIAAHGLVRARPGQDLGGRGSMPMESDTR